MDIHGYLAALGRSDLKPKLEALPMLEKAVANMQVQPEDQAEGAHPVAWAAQSVREACVAACGDQPVLARPQCGSRAVYAVGRSHRRCDTVIGALSGCLKDNNFRVCVVSCPPPFPPLPVVPCTQTVGLTMRARVIRCSTALGIIGMMIDQMGPSFAQYIGSVLLAL